MSDTPGPPPDFRRAVAALQRLRPRRELRITPVAAPPRIAPYTWAFGVEARPDATRIDTAGSDADGFDADGFDADGFDTDEPDTSGRLVLLHDPGGQEAWHGTFRLVCFVQARLEPEQLGDELLAVVGWSWLTEALGAYGASHTALGGTVTQTSSVRFGDIAGPNRETDVELRASWTPAEGELTRHAEAFCALVAVAAGLPPVGATPLVRRTV